MTFLYSPPIAKYPRLFFMVASVVLACMTFCDGQEPAPPEDPDWARRFLADDPLAKRDAVSLQDIRDGLADPKRRGRVIADHLGRVQDAPFDEKRQLLVDALQSEFPEVQQQAATELRNEHELEWVIHDLLVEFLESQDPKARNAAIAGLEQLASPIDQAEMESLRAKIELLADPNDYVALLTAHRLEQDGILALPGLIEAWKAGHTRLPLVVELLADIVYSQATSTRYAVAEARMEVAPEMSEGVAPVIGKSGKAVKTKHEVRKLMEAPEPKLVTVFYGTNRELSERPIISIQSIALYPFVASLLLFAIFATLANSPDSKSGKSGCFKWLMTPLMLAGIGWTLFAMVGGLQQYWRVDNGPTFGPKRDANNITHYGTCNVTIPPRHEIGTVERPTLGPENEQEHVVIQRTDILDESAFFEAVRSRISSLPKSDKSCFVFIHGFNVDFENAARRTAQIHYDLGFEGAPIFFSWPSRASVLGYFYDRAEIEVSHLAIKDFLIDVAERVNADRIHVIAHSMGADATCRAIAEIGERGKIFDQIVLAAPDIDRDVFRMQLAPKLTKTANRTTLYCSKNDLALLLSRNFNDSTRAGDSSMGALVLKDVDTVDASDIDTDLLGHSYYGDCLPLLIDVQKLLVSSLSPQERQLRPWPVDEELLYWTLPEESNSEPPVPQ